MYIHIMGPCGFVQTWGSIGFYRDGMECISKHFVKLSKTARLSQMYGKHDQP